MLSFCDFIQVFVFTKNHHLQHVRYLHVHWCFAVPTASARHMHIRSRTTYDRHYNDNADAVTQQIRELGYKLGAEALRRYYDKATGEGSKTSFYLLLFLSNSLQLADKHKMQVLYAQIHVLTLFE